MVDLRGKKQRMWETQLAKSIIWGWFIPSTKLEILGMVYGIGFTTVL